jgi:2-methylisocitrate lyase-like PEP mutase family enzyme
MVSGVRKKIEDGFRSGRIGVFAKMDGGFGCTNRLTRLIVVFIQARLKAGSFTQRSFPKQKQVISKQQVMNRWAIFGNPKTIDATFPFFFEQQSREDFKA